MNFDHNTRVLLLDNVRYMIMALVIALVSAVDRHRFTSNRSAKVVRCSVTIAQKSDAQWCVCVCVRIGVRRSLSTELFNSRWRKTGRTDGRTEFDWPMTRRLCSGWTVHHVLRMTPVVAKIWVVLTIGMELAFDEGVDASKGASSLKSGESIEILIFLVSFKRSTCNFNKMQRKAGLT